MPRWPRTSDEPRKRVGVCQGDACRKERESGTHNFDAALFRVYPWYRYRCARCYKVETGYDPEP